MIPAEIQSQLLGENLSLIEEIGLGPWFVFELICLDQGQVDEEWEWRKDDHPEWPALKVMLEFSRLDELMRSEEVVACVRTLWSSGWLFDFKQESEGFWVVPAVRTDFFVAFAVQSKLQTIPAPIIEPPPVRPPARRTTARLVRANATMDGQRSKTGVKRATNKVKREARSVKKASAMVGYTGSNASWLDKDGPCGVKANKMGLWMLYQDEYENRFGRPPKIFRKGKPAKGARQLAAIADDYDIETAIRAVAYAIENWEKLQGLFGIAKPPVPETIWWMRHELCHPITQGADPLAEIKKVKKKRRPGSTRKQKQERDEWTEHGDDKESGW